jgi:Phage integrase family
LLGESATEHDERVHPVGFAVQRALMSCGGSDGSPDLVSLRGRVDGAWSIWQGSPRRYIEVSEVLPDLIVDVQAAQRGRARASSPDDRREAQSGSALISFSCSGRSRSGSGALICRCSPPTVVCGRPRRPTIRYGYGGEVESRAYPARPERDGRRGRGRHEGDRGLAARYQRSGRGCGRHGRRAVARLGGGGSAEQRPWTARDRLFPALLNTEVTPHLSQFVGEEDDALVFTSPAGAPMRHSNSYRRAWLPAVRKVGLAAPGVHFHDLRHTGNTLTADAGANLRELMERMGHSSTRAALVYLLDQRPSRLHRRCGRQRCQGGTRPGKEARDQRGRRQAIWHESGTSSQQGVVTCLYKSRKSPLRCVEAECAGQDSNPRPAA